MMTATEAMGFLGNMGMSSPSTGSRGGEGETGLGHGTGRGEAPHGFGGRVRRGCERFGDFFRIGCRYDWEAQYREYRTFWEDYFQGRSGRS